VCVACACYCAATPTSTVTFAPTGSIANKDPGSENALCVPPTELPTMPDACEWSQNETMPSAVTRPALALPCHALPCSALLPCPLLPCPCLQCPLLPFASLSCNAPFCHFLTSSSPPSSAVFFAALPSPPLPVAPLKGGYSQSREGVPRGTAGVLKGIRCTHVRKGCRRA
jgi:hypothetical protein